MAFLRCRGMLRWQPAGAAPRALGWGVTLGGGTHRGDRATVAFVCLCQTDVNKPEFDFQDRLGNIAN